MLLAEGSSCLLTEDNCIKELKDGLVSLGIKMEGFVRCWRFEEIGKKIVAFVEDSNTNYKAVVYDNKKPVHTCNHLFSDSDSVSASGSKVYFPSREHELIELDAETFEEKVLMQEVKLMSATPDQHDFLTVSRDGLLRTIEDKQDLKMIFPRMKDCDWTAVIGVGSFAVIAGCSELCILEGTKLRRMCNYFLLVFRSTLEVVNQANPLSVKHFQERGISVV